MSPCQAAVRSPLQYWLNRAGLAGVDSEIAAFFETPAGMVLLQHMVLVAHLVIWWMAAGGIRLLCTFLVASGLDPFVAHRYGSASVIDPGMPPKRRRVSIVGARQAARVGPPNRLSACFTSMSCGSRLGWPVS